MGRKRSNKAPNPVCPVTGKTGYRRWKHAENDMRTMARSQAERRSAWNVYTCRYCNLFHVGHAPWHLNPTTKKRKRNDEQA